MVRATGTRTESVRESSTIQMEASTCHIVERKSTTRQIMHGTGLTACRMEPLPRTRMCTKILKPENGATESVMMERPTESGYAMMRMDTW